LRLQKYNIFQFAKHFSANFSNFFLQSIILPRKNVPLHLFKQAVAFFNERFPDVAFHV